MSGGRESNRHIYKIYIGQPFLRVHTFHENAISHLVLPNNFLTRFKFSLNGVFFLYLHIFPVSGVSCTCETFVILLSAGNGTGINEQCEHQHLQECKDVRASKLDPQTKCS